MSGSRSASATVIHPPVMSACMRFLRCRSAATPSGEASRPSPFATTNQPPKRPIPRAYSAIERSVRFTGLVLLGCYEASSVARTVGDVSQPASMSMDAKAPNRASMAGSIVGSLRARRRRYALTSRSAMAASAERSSDGPMIMAKEYASAKLTRHSTRTRTAPGGIRARAFNRPGWRKS